MRFFIVSAMLLGAVTAEGGQFIPDGGKTLEEVYGPMAEIDVVIPWYERGIHRTPLPEHYFDVRATDNCTFPLEVYIIQDETGSFADNYKQMKDVELSNMYNNITANHPGSTFGVGTHRDIPIWTLGDPMTDYCWQFRLPLSSNYTALYDTYDQLFSTGGGDAPEYQFGSIIAACQTKTPGWSNPMATRLVVVSTDAQPHFEDDGFNKPEYGLKPYSGRFDEANPGEQCTTQYYPSPSHVKAAFSRLEGYAAFLIFDGEYNQGGLPIKAWNWFNSFIGQSSEFVSNVQEGATDFWEKLLAVIEAIENVECVHERSTTTTIAPTSDPTTTMPTTETPTITIGTTPAPSTTLPTTETTTTAIATTPAPSTTMPTTATTTTTHATTPITETPMTELVTEDPECPECPEGHCRCPAVKIMLRDKPAQLRLEVNNTVVV